MPTTRKIVKANGRYHLIETLQDDECSNNFHQVKAHLLHKILRGET